MILCGAFGLLLNRKPVLFNVIHCKVALMLKLARSCDSSRLGAVQMQRQSQSNIQATSNLTLISKACITDQHNGQPSSWSYQDACTMITHA